MIMASLEQQLQHVMEAKQTNARQNPTAASSAEEDLSKVMEGLSLQQNFKPEETPQEQPADNSPSHPQEPEEYHTKDFVELTRNNISFDRGIIFPGSIDEVELAVGLRDDAIPDDDPAAAYLLRIIALCSNTEFNDLDEYVFSVRSNERYEYYEEVRFRIKKREKAQVRIAVKVPVVRTPYQINGTLTIQLENTIPVVLPISCKSEMPQIVCMKELFEVEEGTRIIKIPAKKSMRIPPIPFKNCSPFTFVLEIETATTENFSDRPYDIISQSTTNCMANAPFFVNLQLKTNMSYRGALPVSDTIRKVLLLKVKNSTVYFSYPIEAYVFEGTAASAVS